MKFDHRFVLQNAAPAMREYAADGVRMRLDFFEGMLRVALLRDNVPLVPTWSVWPGAGDCPLEGRDKLSSEGLECAVPEVEESEESVEFRLSGVFFRVEKRNFRLSAWTPEGLLYQDRDGLAYNFDGELGDGSVHFTRRFEGERIFGLGDKCGDVNKSGRSFALGADDAMGFLAKSSDPLYKQIPFYICENAAGSYGLYYDTYSNGRVDFGQEHDNYFEPFNSIRFEEENMVFYLFLGTTREILQHFTALTGGAAPVPEWAFRYCGSTMEYTDAPDADLRLRGFLEKCEEYGIRPGAFYLSSGYTQIGERRCVFHWNTDKIPDPENLADTFRAAGAEILPNVKPAFLTEHPLYDEIARNGWFLHYADGSPARFPFWGGMASYLDFTNPGAFTFWKKCVREKLVDKGYRNIWNDNNEYDVWDKDVYAAGFGQEIPARRLRPLFSYLMARASREASEEAAREQGKDPSEEAATGIFNISRCAIAGTQRVATTWTGDNRTSFEDLRYNHRQDMTMALTGFLFFGPDIGGFAGPTPSEELFLRWLQYGVFLPRFVLHSWKPGEASTMPWLYLEHMDKVRCIFDLRERLVPYLYEEAEAARKFYLPLIRPVFLEEPGYDCESDCFFVGRRILACPVFDPGADSVTVLLPEHAPTETLNTSKKIQTPVRWFLRGTGEPIPGGQPVTVKCLPDDEPVWFINSMEEKS